MISLFTETNEDQPMNVVAAALGPTGKKLTNNNGPSSKGPTGNGLTSDGPKSNVPTCNEAYGPTGR